MSYCCHWQSYWSVFSDIITTISKAFVMKRMFSETEIHAKFCEKVAIHHASSILSLSHFVLNNFGVLSVTFLFYFPQHMGVDISKSNFQSS